MGRKGSGHMSGDFFSGIRGVISRSRDMCCRDTLYLLPMTSRSSTTLENSGREVGWDFQHSPMSWESSFVHGL